MGCSHSSCLQSRAACGRRSGSSTRLLLSHSECTGGSSPCGGATLCWQSSVLPRLQGRAVLWGSLPSPGGFIQQRAISLPMSSSWAVPLALASAWAAPCPLHVYSLALVPGCAAALRRSPGRVASVDKTQHLGISLFEALFPVFSFVSLRLGDFCAYPGRCRVSWLSPQPAGSPGGAAVSTPADLSPQECAAGPALCTGNPPELPGPLEQESRGLPAGVKVCACSSVSVHPRDL